MSWGDFAESLQEFQTAQAEDADEYQVCVDTAGDATDEWGNSCQAYTEYPTTCGAGDNPNFVASDLCCACGGGSTADQKDCEDTNDGALDSDGFSCIWYDNDPSACGQYDTSTFISAQMCCSCGGGLGDYFDPLTEVEATDSVQDIIAEADNVGDVFLAVVNNPVVLWNSFTGFFGG